MNRRQFNLSTAMTFIASMLPIPAIAKPEYPRLEVINDKECMITKKPFFVPDIFFVERDWENRTFDHNNNWTTSVYTRMELWIPTVDGLMVSHAIPSHERYKEWVDKYWDKDIPPHISFGGAIKSIPNGDPTFKSRWEQDTLSKIRNGELV